MAWTNDFAGIGVPAPFGVAIDAALVAPVVAAVVAHVLIRALLASALARHFADHPNERSLHAAPVPRTGGLGIMAGLVAASAMIGCDVRVVGGALALAALSMLDDLRGLPVLVRFAGHFAIAGYVLLHLAPDWPGWFVAAAVIGTVWMTNLYNFMDGSDGLAGGMAFFGFGAYAIGALLGGAPGLAAVAGAVSGAAAGFLVLNFHPARVFMGDAGSIPLGFLAAALGIAGATEGCWPLWFPIVVFAPFIADATATLGRRLLAGERIWQAHRKHYYQRMVRIGWGHARVALGEYGIMATLAVAALVARNAAAPVQALLVGAVAAGFAGFALWFDRRWVRHERGVAPSGTDR